MYDTDNIFAKILRKEIPARVIFENDVSLAILDAFPCTQGHALLIPKAEIVGVEELEGQSAEFLAQLMRDIAKLNSIVRKAANVEATNTIANSHPASGQIVPHLHFHVIPRRPGDRLIKHPEPNSSQAIDLDKILEDFKEAANCHA